MCSASLASPPKAPPLCSLEQPGFYFQASRWDPWYGTQWAAALHRDSHGLCLSIPFPTAPAPTAGITLSLLSKLADPQKWLQKLESLRGSGPHLIAAEWLQVGIAGNAKPAAICLLLRLPKEGWNECYWRPRGWKSICLLSHWLSAVMNLS